jgi:putative chitobiose transport system permease protein
MRRNQNDVFVLGEESLLAETIAPREPAPAAEGDGREGGGPLPPSSPARPTGFPAGSALGVRKLAVLGLGAAAAATFGALELSSGTGPAHLQGDRTSQHSALVVSSAPIAAAPAAPPAPVRRLDPMPRPRSPHLSLQRRPRDNHRSETERRPNSEQAPVSSPVEVSASPPPAPVAIPAPAPTLPPRVPSPSPPSGGDSGSIESFGFER